MLIRTALLAALLGAAVLPAFAAEEPRLSWLENGRLRLGIDLRLGGAITWLSRAEPGAENLINSHDWGREVQMSFYAGPIPFWVGEKRPAPVWEKLGWNPIQAGDAFGFRSQVLEHENHGTSLRVKCVPMQWPLREVPGDCTFESWIELEGSTVKVRGLLRNARTDHTPYAARAQELPALYTNARWHRLLTYTGPAPGSGAPVVEIPPAGPPAWTHWLATEHWSALVDDAGQGLGLYQPDCVRFIGGFNGRPGEGGPADNPCGYLAPVREEILDHDIEYPLQYRLLLGSVAEIRAAAQAWQGPPSTRLVWSFHSSREGWTHHHAEDAGWPIHDGLVITITSDDSQLHSPRFVLPCAAAPVVTLEAALDGPGGTAKLFWATSAAPGFAAERRVLFSLPSSPEGGARRCTIPVPLAPGEALVQLRLDPPPGTRSWTVKSVAVGPAAETENARR